MDGVNAFAENVDADVETLTERVVVLEENAIDAEGFTSTKLTDKIVREAFAIVCMTESQKDFLTDMRWNALRKAGAEAQENNVYSFYELCGYEVIDPYGKDIDCYRYVYTLLSMGMDCLIERLQLRVHAYVPKTKAKTSTQPKKRGRPKKAKEEQPLLTYIEN